MSKFPTILISFLSLFLISCSSGSKQYLENARKYYDAKLYQKSLSELNLGVKKFPRDADLNIALVKTRNKVYENELIRIRDTRAAGDPLQALKQVRKVDNKFASWNMKSDLNGSEFRKKQITSLFYDYKNLILRDLVKGHILKAHIELKKFRDILGPLKEYEVFESEILARGRQKCQSLQGDSYTFFTHFISKYCDYFKGKSSGVADLKDELFNVSRYEVVIGGKTIKNPPNFLSTSKLYHPGSAKVVSVGANITFNYKENSKIIKKHKDYREKIFYTDTVKESYFVPEKYWTTELVCNYVVQSTQPCKNQRVQKTRLATRWRDKKVRKHRYENRTYHYKVKEITQTMALTGKANLRFANVRIPVDLSKKETFTDYGHNYNHRKSGVRPKKLSTKDPVEWKNSFISYISERLKEVIHADWQKQYCRWEGTPQEINENSARCYFASTKNPFLNEWSLNFANLNFNDLKKELRL